MSPSSTPKREALQWQLHSLSDWFAERHWWLTANAVDRLALAIYRTTAQHQQAKNELHQLIADNAGRAAFLHSHPAVTKELCDLIEENERLTRQLADATATLKSWIKAELLTPAAPAQANVTAPPAAASCVRGLLNVLAQDTALNRTESQKNEHPGLD